MSVRRFSEADFAGFDPSDPDTALIRWADPQYAAFASSLLPGCPRHLLGVPVPELRRFARGLVRRGGFPAIRPASFESVMLLGFCTAFAGGSFEERARRVEAFLPLIDNWSVCDSFCAALRFPPSEEEAWFRRIEPLFADERTYYARFAVVCALFRFNGAAYCERVLERLCSVSNGAYYARMAVAWAVSAFYKSFPAQTLPLLSARRLDAWTHNKAIAKICELRGAAPEEKQRLRAMKISGKINDPSR